MPDEPNKKPEIITDEDWKAQAQKEKTKLEEAEQAAPKPPSTRGPLPPASMLTLINSLVMQTLYHLGRLGDSQSHKPEVDLDMAKHHIDTLQLLEDKTQGHLSDEEKKALSLALHEMRLLYVQICQ